MKEALELKYLKRLAELYPSIAKASTEIINLQSILNLPKGTEHFITDLHGEYEAFSHMLRNGSGSVRKKIDDVFGHTLSAQDKKDLATLIYYPREKMSIVVKSVKNIQEWYRISLYRLIEICKMVASKYTRSKVRKALPPEFSYVIEELITEKPEVLNKEAYYNAIVDSIIEVGRAPVFIIALCELIRGLSLIICIFWAISLTEVRIRTEFWINCRHITAWISSGATTMCSGWAPQQGRWHVSHV